jgi:hypothetical protein
MENLARMGVGRLFGPGASTQDIAQYIHAWYAGRFGEAALASAPARPSPHPPRAADARPAATKATAHAGAPPRRGNAKAAKVATGAKAGSGTRSARATASRSPRTKTASPRAARATAARSASGRAARAASAGRKPARRRSR